MRVDCAFVFPWSFSKLQTYHSITPWLFARIAPAEFGMRLCFIWADLTTTVSADKRSDLEEHVAWRSSTLVGTFGGDDVVTVVECVTADGPSLQAAK